MTTRTASTVDEPFIEDRAQLIDVIARGEKPSDAWKIGTEHEKFVYRCDGHSAPSYDEPTSAGARSRRAAR